MSDISNKFDMLISRLQVKHASGNQYQCLCPAHDDKQASLSVNLTEDKILVHCQAGCDTRAVLSRLNMRLADLFPRNGNGKPYNNNSNSNKPAPPKQQPKQAVQPKPVGKIVAVYQYHDTDGTLLFEVVRREPKDFRQRHYENGKVVNNMQGVKRVPYNLPNVAGAIKAGSVVYVVEGEKDVHALAEIKCCATCNPGGAGKWLDIYSEHLKGAHVILIPDNDPSGYEHMTRVAVNTHQFAARVQYLMLPGLPPKGDVSDYLATHSAEEFIALVEKTARDWQPGMEIKPSEAEQLAMEINPELPTININNRQQRDITADCLQAIETNPATSLYIRLGTLVRLRHVKREAYIEIATADIVRHAISQSANITRETTRGTHSAMIPVDIAKDILARGSWTFPSLTAITQSPVMRQDGSILLEPGYDELTGLYYAPIDNVQLGTIPEKPAAADIAEARDVLDELICDFPFAEPADYANAIAMMLTQAIRPAIGGLVPMAIINSPQPGTGKGKLSSIIHIIATGREASTTSAPIQPEEWEKKLTSLMAEGRQIILFDNVEHPVNAPELASLLTTPEWGARVLGQSRMIYIPNRSSVIVNGNNVRVGGDIGRRCYWTTIDAQTSTPELRREFKHDPLEPWVKQNRAKILTALFTLARAWYSAGQPECSTIRLGSFTEWSRTIGGILETAGIDGFLGNAEMHRVESDELALQTQVFLEALSIWAGSTPFTTKEIERALSDNPPLVDALPDYLAVSKEKGNSTFVRTCGNYFSKIKSKRFGKNNIRIERLPILDHHAVKWMVKTDEKQMTNKPNTAIKDYDNVVWVK